MVAGDEDTPVLNCYWLARWYHQSPEIFLAMPMSDVQMHVYRTYQIVQRMRNAQADDGD